MVVVRYLHENLIKNLALQIVCEAMDLAAPVLNRYYGHFCHAASCTPPSGVCPTFAREG
jgi:hypothetical protein